MFHETHDFVQKASGEAFWRLKLSFAQLRVSRGILGTYHGGALCGLARDAEDGKLLYNGKTAEAIDVRSGNLRAFDINDFNLQSMTHMLYEMFPI